MSVVSELCDCWKWGTNLIEDELFTCGSCVKTSHTGKWYRGLIYGGWIREMCRPHDPQKFFLSFFLLFSFQKIFFYLGDREREWGQRE